MSAVWVTGQTSSFVVYCMTLSAFCTVGVVILSLEGSRSGGRVVMRGIFFLGGIVLQALVDPRSITSAAVEIGIKLLPHTVVRRLMTRIRTGETRR